MKEGLPNKSPFLSPPDAKIGTLGWQAIFAVCDLVATACPHCTDAPSLAVFMKDIVNIKTGKPVFDKKNFRHWMELIQKNEGAFAEPEQLEALITKVDILLSRVTDQPLVYAVVEHDSERHKFV